MARFYASIQGNRGEATRAGHGEITGHVRGWESGVRIYGTGDKGGPDVFTVYATSGSNGSGGAVQVLGRLVDGAWVPAGGGGEVKAPTSFKHPE